MPPNWGRFQTIVHQMITDTMGAEPVILETPGEIVYDFDIGEIEKEPTQEELNLAIIPTNKDDLKDLPEGLRDRATRKIFTVNPIPKNAKIISKFDAIQYEVIVPSVAYTAGGLVHCYRTYLGKIENSQLAKIPEPETPEEPPVDIDDTNTSGDTDNE